MPLSIGGAFHPPGAGGGGGGGAAGGGFVFGPEVNAFLGNNEAAAVIARGLQEAVPGWLPAYDANLNLVISLTYGSTVRFQRRFESAWQDVTGLVTGPRGITGAAGTHGDDGPTGPQGGAGPTGPIGPAGPAGGPQGPAGPQGDPGAQGAAGAAGGVGPQGDPGAAGSQGGVGPQGDPGAAGGAGPAGAQGNPGAAGAAGAMGPAGAQGVMGDAGAGGAQGVAGSTGPAGDTGRPGYSVRLTARIVASTDIDTDTATGTLLALFVVGSVRHLHLRNLSTFDALLAASFVAGTLLEIEAATGEIRTIRLTGTWEADPGRVPYDDIGTTVLPVPSDDASVLITQARPGATGATGATGAVGADASAEARLPFQLHQSVRTFAGTGADPVPGSSYQTLTLSRAPLPGSIIRATLVQQAGDLVGGSAAITATSWLSRTASGVSSGVSNSVIEDIARPNARAWQPGAAVFRRVSDTQISLAITHGGVWGSVQVTIDEETSGNDIARPNASGQLPTANAAQLAIDGAGNPRVGLPQIDPAHAGEVTYTVYAATDWRGVVADLTAAYGLATKVTGQRVYVVSVGGFMSWDGSNWEGVEAPTGYLGPFSTQAAAEAALFRRTDAVGLIIFLASYGDDASPEVVVAATVTYPTGESSSLHWSKFPEIGALQARAGLLEQQQEGLVMYGHSRAEITRYVRSATEPAGLSFWFDLESGIVASAVAGTFRSIDEADASGDTSLILWILRGAVNISDAGVLAYDLSTVLQIQHEEYAETESGSYHLVRVAADRWARSVNPLGVAGVPRPLFSQATARVLLWSGKSYEAVQTNINQVVPAYSNFAQFDEILVEVTPEDDYDGPKLATHWGRFYKLAYSDRHLSTNSVTHEQLVYTLHIGDDIGTRQYAGEVAMPTGSSSPNAVDGTYELAFQWRNIHASSTQQDGNITAIAIGPWSGPWLRTNTSFWGVRYAA